MRLLDERPRGLSSQNPDRRAVPSHIRDAIKAKAEAKRARRAERCRRDLREVVA